VNFAWPNAEIAVMGPRARWRSSSAKRRTTRPSTAREAEYKARFANPFVAGARGFIDDVIMPHETRKRICRSLVMLKDKQAREPVAQARQHPALSRGEEQDVYEDPDCQPRRNRLPRDRHV
jgi:acetyl-CoA carboxylase carboxyltransferase component